MKSNSASAFTVFSADSYITEKPRFNSLDIENEKAISKISRKP
jgi:hypothetical protein